MRELAEYLNNAKNKKEDKSKASQFQSLKEKEELKKGMNDRMLQNIADKEAETKRKLNSINQESEGSQRKFTKRW